MKTVSKSIIIVTILIALYSCTRKKIEVPELSSNYPMKIESIMKTKCAVSGCHNTISKDAAAGLDLSSWEKLFEGGRSGSAVIASRPDYSLIIYYTNHDSILPYLQLLPTMPIGESALTSTELTELMDWILDGAPNAQGRIRFQDDINVKKFYTCCQGCDQIAVFEAQSMLAMRYISVGQLPTTEAPHMIKVAPNNEFYCVSFLASNFFQKFSTVNNSLISQVEIGFGSWNTFAISSDSKHAYVVDLLSGVIAFIDLDNMTSQNINFGFSFPHGSALNLSDDTLYVTAQQGSNIWKIPVNDYSNHTQINFAGGNHRFHEIHFSPDGSKYFLTAQNTNLILVVNTRNDSLIATIPVGVLPQEMGISESKPYLFVSCMDDQITFPGKTGSVYVINYNTLQVVGRLYTGHQPHGIAVDDENGRVYISNRNVTLGGPAPHHSSVCNGRNGYMTAIDLNSLLLIPNFQAEVSVDPYGVGITH
ncbi:MAG: hypothetical protein RIQ89_2269 [Bacteroidota bacterium]|jgi:DNA-binding beta-propeller fold protein YncE